MSETRTAPPVVATRRGGRAHPGPPLAAPAISAALAITVSRLVGRPPGAGPVSWPLGHVTAIERYVPAHHTAMAVSAWLLLLASTALVFFSAVAWSRLSFLAPNAPGPAIAGFGGLAAAGLLAVAGSLQWLLSRPGVTMQPGLVRVLIEAVSVLSGPAYLGALAVAMLGLAVTAWFVRRTPRWLSIAGIVIAVIDVVAGLSLLSASLAPLLTVGAAASLLWIVAISLWLPRTRAARGERQAVPDRYPTSAA